MNSMNLLQSEGLNGFQEAMKYILFNGETLSTIVNKKFNHALVKFNRISINSNNMYAIWCFLEPLSAWELLTFDVDKNDIQRDYNEACNHFLKDGRFYRTENTAA